MFLLSSTFVLGEGVAKAWKKNVKQKATDLEFNINIEN